MKYDVESINKRKEKEKKIKKISKIITIFMYNCYRTNIFK